MRAEGEYSSKLVKTSFVDRHAEMLNYGDHFNKQDKRRMKSAKHMFGYSHICQKLLLKRLQGKHANYEKSG